jgi:ribosome-binding protein aMBF1 (putative translation factor)
MAFPKDSSAVEGRCEICGADLMDELVVQEFVDGRQVCICRECAAGAQGTAPTGDSEPASRSNANQAAFPEAGRNRVTSPGEVVDRDLTEELLMPVTDLIALQKDVQSALERLASSLERFAAEVLVQSSDETGRLENRLRTLERELEQTRKRLQDTEGLMVSSAPHAAVAQPVVSTEADQEQPSTVVAPAVPLSATAVSPPPPAAAVPTGPAPVPPPAPEETPHGFTLEAVQLTQRYFNDGVFVDKIRGVRRSLGKPRANLSRIAGHGVRVFVTVAWDIVWYQFVVDLARDLPQEERVSLFREGMDLAELASHFKESNTIVDEDGRIDASELEVALLSDPSALITDMTPEEEQALEDATEEIWDQHTSPEFKWDD